MPNHLSGESRKATAEELAFLNGKPTETPAPSGLIPLLEGEQIAQEGWADDPVMVGRMAIDGFTWGFSDESVAAIRGVINKTIRQDPRPYQEIYAETINGLEQTRAQYNERNPVAALALNVVGSIPTAGAVKGLLTKGFGMVAPVVAPMIPSALNFGRATPLVAGATTLAAEGAISGIGYAQQGEDLGQAAIDGMTTNLIFGAATNTLGTAWRATSKVRVADSMGTGADFKPLPVVAPNSNLAKVYGNILGRTFFGKNLLEQQVNRWRVPLARNIEEESLALKNLGALPTLEGSLASRVSSATKDLNNLASGRIGEITEESTRKLEEETAKIVSSHAAVATRIDDAVNMQERIFRNKTVEASLPAGMPPEEAKKVITRSRTMQNAVDSARAAWDEYGYQYLKVLDGAPRIFLVDTDELIEDIQGRVAGDAKELILQFGESAGKATTFVDDYLKATVVDGKISGEQLSNLRSNLGTMAGNLTEQGGDAALRGYVIRQVLASVNTKIRSQLSTKREALDGTIINEVELFDKDNAAWNTKLIFETAVGSASTDAGTRGAFTPTQWLQAARSVNPRKLSGGQAILQNQADNLGQLQKRRDASIQQLSDYQQKRKQLAISSRRELLAEETASIKAELAASIQQQTSGMTQETAARNAELISRQKALLDMQSQLTAIDNAMPKDSTDSKFINLILMGASGFAGGPMALGAYLGAGKVASTQGFQRALAGQTAVQAGMRNLVERLPTEQIASVAGRENVRQDQQEFTLSEQNTVARIGNDRAKAAAYRRLEASGNLEQLRSRNFSAFKSLKEAFDRQQ